MPKPKEVLLRRLYVIRHPDGRYFIGSRSRGSNERGGYTSAPPDKVDNWFGTFKQARIYPRRNAANNSVSKVRDTFNIPNVFVVGCDMILDERKEMDL